MNPVSSLNENAQKWVRALRSGLFQQGHGFLRQDENDARRYCCLGVACELAKLDGVEISVEKKKDSDEIYLYDGSSGLLPQSVMDWLGLNDSDGMFSDAVHSPDGVFLNLTELNDSAGYTFEEIANFVESNPDGLFRHNTQQ